MAFWTSTGLLLVSPCIIWSKLHVLTNWLYFFNIEITLDQSRTKTVFTLKFRDTLICMQTFVVSSKNLTGLRKGIQIEASCWHGKHYNIHVSLNDLIYTNQWVMFGTNYQVLCFCPCHFCGIRCVTVSFIFWFFTYCKTSTKGSSKWCSLNPHDCFETLALPILSTHSWKDS